MKDADIQKYMKREKREAWLNKYVLPILLFLAGFLVYLNVAVAQTEVSDTTKIDTIAQQPYQPGMIGGMGGAEINGIDGSGVNLDVFIRSTLYANKTRNGMNLWGFADMQISNRNSPWALFAVGGGYRFPLGKQKKRMSFLEMGVGAGITTKSSPAHVLGYGLSIFSIKGHYMMIYASVDIATNGLYRYRNFAVFQVTESGEDIDFYLGLHAESDAVLGPTIQFHMGNGHVIMSFAGGVNPNRNYNYGLMIGLFGNF